MEHIHALDCVMLRPNIADDEACYNWLHQNIYSCFKVCFHICKMSYEKLLKLDDCFYDSLHDFKRDLKFNLMPFDAIDMMPPNLPRRI